MLMSDPKADSLEERYQAAAVATKAVRPAEADDGPGWFSTLFWFGVSTLLSLIPLPAILHFARAFSRRIEYVEGDEFRQPSKIVSIVKGVAALLLMLTATAAITTYVWALVSDYGSNPLSLVRNMSEEQQASWLKSLQQIGIPLFYSLEFLFISLLPQMADQFRMLREAVARRTNVFGNLLLFGLSLLPLSVIILVLPALFPNEAVLTDTTKTYRSFWVGLMRRIIAIFTALAVMIVLFAVSVEMVSMLKLTKSYVSDLPNKIFPAGLVKQLPRVAVEQWHYVLICVYLIDLVLLFAIGKVPFKYNIRNLRTRWVTTVMTSMAFTLVVALLMMMFAFVNGLNMLTSASGVPGNVFILSEGSTDETFSNIDKNGAADLDSQVATEDRSGNVLKTPVTFKEVAKPGRGKVRMVSRETYISVNHEIPRKPEQGPMKSGESPKRRLLPVRAVDDAFIAAKVHNIEILEGELFDDNTSPELDENKLPHVACLLGEGAAVKFGEDYAKGRMKPGDKFKIGELRVFCIGIMKTEGTTFGSETWVRWNDATDKFNKKTYTTIVARVKDDTTPSADAMAYHLSTNYKKASLRCVTELQYFEDLAKSSQSFFTLILIIAAIMAIGGIFGVMNTMFAAISQRIKDIGILRILGFKRWQLLISFMLETLAIAIFGGLIGCCFGMLADGYKMESVLSSGGPGGKTVLLRLTVDTTILVCAVLFTIVMGRLGGLVPSLSAMRLKILDSLR